ncbi:DNA photolyase phr1 [Massospora cicadina]|nr:DNA photolyase phr1 [Massospora cicadina]
MNGPEDTHNEKNLLMWFRTDLRLADNRALEGALRRFDQLNENKEVTSLLFCLFIVSIGEWREHEASKFKVDFIMRNIKELKERLEQHEIPLVVEITPRKDDIPNIVLNMCTAYHIYEVYYNMEYEVNERKRDGRVKDLLNQNSVNFMGYHDQCVVPPSEIPSSKHSKPFEVYTPFRKAWMAVVSENKRYLSLSSSVPQSGFRQLVRTRYPYAFESCIPLSIEGFELSPELQATALQLYPAGESKALERMHKFIAEKIGRYKDDRDFVCKPGTSVISPYLTSGIISPRQCIHLAQKANKGELENGSAGVVKWISEIVWREFYRYILFAFPRVSKSLPFVPEARHIQWDEREGHFDAWKEGKTGYPLVDAGMRELKNTGWVSNRIRMTVASFLSKDLLINWQKGESHFMQHLIDGDLASNNGGWQWAASTGTDPKSYLRIFNPLLQSEKFDPDGDYIRKWLPELRDQFDQLG